MSFWQILYMTALKKLIIRQYALIFEYRFLYIMITSNLIYFA